MDLSRNIPKPPGDEFSNSGRHYLSLVPDDKPVLEQLYENSLNLKKLLLSCSEQQVLFRYDVNKWTIKEILVHLIDDERIYAYRALCFARGEKAMLPGFNQDNYAVHSEANKRSLHSILTEYQSVRMATLNLFCNLPEEALARKGYADHWRVSVRALIFHITAMNYIISKF